MSASGPIPCTFIAETTVITTTRPPLQHVVALLDHDSRFPEVHRYLLPIIGSWRPKRDRLPKVARVRSRMETSMAHDLLLP